MAEDPKSSVDTDRTAAMPAPARGRTPSLLDDDQPTRVIDRYHLIKKIGEGGMGEVWEAEQRQPVQRKVALKLIKRGMDSDQVIARFESERQALALMDHSAIARVFDAGTTERGRPYFVMELVHGVPITDYCDRHRLSVHQRLELFIEVCEGLQHAHQKAIIHRDVKPSNILVTEQDGRPVPKIIDFGVAKATSQRLTERTLFTELGQFIGTPDYMSPEQSELTGEDIDIRTDVYSLGMVLYELLIGALPFDPKELRQAGLVELQRRIREDEPPRPSTQVTRQGETSTETAANRHTTLPALVKTLRGDLDWIVLKALEKDRNRRYETAHAFALDIERFLTNQAVEARPPSTVYRARKFVRRHRLGVAAVSLVFVAIVLGIVLATIGLVQAKRAEARAMQEALTATQVSEFLEGLFEVSDPTEAQGNTITAREILDQGADRIRYELVGQPVVQARLMNTMGNVYSSLALYDDSRSLLEETLATRRNVLGERHPDVAESLHDLAKLQTALGHYEVARPLYEEALSIREEALGADAPEVAETLNDFARLHTGMDEHQEARALLERAFAIREQAFGPDHLEVADSLNALGILLGNLGEHEEARQLLERALEIRTESLGPDHPHVASTLRNLAIALSAAGDLEGARLLDERVLAIREKVYGPNHPEVAASLNNLGFVLELMGHYAEALPLYQRALKISEESFGPEHPGVARHLQNVSIIHSLQGNHAVARPLLERALAINEKALGPDHSIVAAMLGNLAIVNERMGRYEEAVDLRERSVVVYEKALGPDHPAVADGLTHLGYLRAEAGDYQEALSLHQRALEIRKEKLGPDHAEVAISQACLAAVYTETGDHEEARSLFESALAIQQEALEPNHPDVAQVLDDYAKLLFLTDDFTGSEQAYQRALAIREEKLGANHPDLAETLEGYSNLLREIGRNEEAKSFESKAAAIRENAQVE